MEHKRLLTDDSGKKLIKGGITWQLRKGEQSFLCATHHPDLIHNSIKLHEDILNCY